MYKTYLYKLATFFSPNFDRYITKILQHKNSLKILDIGFYKGSFSKAIISKLLSIESNKFFTLYSFDPNKNTVISEFENFITNKNVNWIHKSIAIGDIKKEEEFTILSSFLPRDLQLTIYFKILYGIKQENLYSIRLERKKTEQL